MSLPASLPPAWVAHLPAIDDHFMRIAIEQANRCEPITTGYSVGAALVRIHTPTLSTPTSPTPSSSPPPSTPTPTLSDLLAHHFTIVSTGHSRELPGNTHAEECCLLKLHTQPPHSPLSPHPPPPFSPLPTPHWLYTTMEPCSLRLSGKVSCSQHVLSAHIPRVVIGVPEPPVFVANCQGTTLLTTAGVSCSYTPHLAATCLHPNRHLLQSPPP